MGEERAEAGALNEEKKGTRILRPAEEQRAASAAVGERRGGDEDALGFGKSIELGEGLNEGDASERRKEGRVGGRWERKRERERMEWKVEG